MAKDSILEGIIDRCPNLTKELMTDGLYLGTIESLIVTALSTLEQNGFKTGVFDYISDYDVDRSIEWGHLFLTTNLDNKIYEVAKQYVALYVQLMFDPPSATHQAIMEKSLDHLLWRIRLGVETNVDK